MKIISLNKGFSAFILGLLLWCCPTRANTLGARGSTFFFQQGTSGTISDGTGPVPGVTIAVKGTEVYAVTDANGKFTITAAPADVLIISAIGYKTLEVPIGRQSILTILLQEDSTALEEVVINAGYYTVKDKERTGSIARITSKDIESQPVTNVLATMQGRMAGVSVTQSTGTPGGGFDIKIRGQNSLRADGNSPLYIVDGMPYASGAFSNTSISGVILPGGGSNPLSSINPSDIESIEVLKDADATSIYGSRGANGVVLITTKKGKAGRTKFSVNAYTGFGNITQKANLMKTPEYLAMRREAFSNDGITEYPDYAYDVNGTWDQGRNTDWQEELIGGTSVINNLQASVSGGNENTRFVLSNTVYKETTVFPGDFAYRKIAANFNVNHTSENRRFNIDFSGNYISDKNNLPGIDLTRQALTLAPNAPSLYDASGNLNWENSTWSNPVAFLEEKYLAQNNTLIANAMLRYELVKGLEFKTALGFSDNRFKESKQTPSTIYDPAFGLGSEASTMRRNNVEAQSWNVEPQLSYRYEHGRGTLQALAGLTFMERTSRQDGIFASGFSSNSLIGNPAMASFVVALNATDTEYRYNAVFARLNYNWDGRYFLNLTGRRDGSSRFGPGKQFANFGAVGAAWLFSRESWVSESLPFLSFGKLRGSYGTTGNDQIGDYQFLNMYGASGLEYQNVAGLQPIRLFNPDFSWETNRKLEAAIELGLVKDRVFLTTAWYRNRSSNQLVGVPLPGTTGFTSIVSNLDAVVQNSGWEFELRLIPFQKKDFEWTSSLNLTVPKTELIAFPDLESSTYAQQYVVGQPLDIMLAYQYEGVDPDTGVYLFKDFNGDGVISPEGDRKLAIQRSPKYFAGWQNSLTYKNWKLDFLLQYVNQLGADSDYMGILPGTASNITSRNNVWQQGGDQAAKQRYTTGFDDAASTAFYNYIASNAIFTDASYLRLKNLMVSYTLPQSFAGNTGCRLYLQGQNLLTLTGYKGADPETQFSGYLPPLRILSMGVELTF